MLCVYLTLWLCLVCVCVCVQGVLEHITVNNFPIGRNVDEALRTLQVGWVWCYLGVQSVVQRTNARASRQGQGG